MVGLYNLLELLELLLLCWFFGRTSNDSYLFNWFVLSHKNNKPVVCNTASVFVLLMLCIKSHPDFSNSHKLSEHGGKLWEVPFGKTTQCSLQDLLIFFFSSTEAFLALKWTCALNPDEIWNFFLFSLPVYTFVTLLSWLMSWMNHEIGTIRHNMKPASIIFLKCFVCTLLSSPDPYFLHLLSKQSSFFSFQLHKV